jgi:hypothetical protein
MYQGGDKRSRQQADRCLRTEIHTIPLQEWFALLDKVDFPDDYALMAAAVVLGYHRDANEECLSRLARLALRLRELRSTTAYRILDGMRRLLGRGVSLTFSLDLLSAVKHFEDAGGDETTDVARRVRALLEERLVPPRPPYPTYTENYRCVHWYDGVDYALTPAAAGIVKLLWEAWISNAPKIEEATIRKTLYLGATSRPAQILGDQRRGTEKADLIAEKVVVKDGVLFWLAFRDPLPPRSLP